ncbi:TPA: DNA-binding protein [Vibrio parahaemolyticus]|nr:DNA-binding protein [Vibrio parahaemolyticus]
MANVRTFTDEEVLAAAKQLQDEGKNVTANALRRIIGKGRPNTLFETYGELLAKGEAQQASTEVDQPIVMNSYELPSEIAENLEQAKSNLEAIFKSAYDMAMHTVEARLNKAMKEAGEAKVKAEELVAQAEESETKAYDEAEAERMKREDAEEALTAAQTEIEKLKEEVQKLNTACLEHKATIQDRDGELKQVKAELSTSQSKTTELEREVVVVKSDLETARTEVREKKEDLTAAHKELRERDQQNGSLQARNESLQEKLELALSEVEQLKKPKPRQRQSKSSQQASESAK